LRHASARPDLRGYKVSSKSAEESHSYNTAHMNKEIQFGISNLFL